MYKFISWNIDSLNAALTSDSPRALLSREVLNTIAKEEADIIAIQETKLPAAGPAKKRMDQLGTARKKGLCRNHDPLQRRDQGGEDRAQDRSSEHNG